MNYQVPYVGTKTPTVEDIWVVVPLSRPEMVHRVQSNVERQRVGARVCVVENGRAVGACKANGFEPDVLLTSEQHQSIARNTALEHLRRAHPDAYWVSMDDDDYYGSEYVAEHAGLAKRGQVVGKYTHWVLFEDRFLALFRPWDSSGSGKALNGGTIGAYVADSPNFVEIDRGEDTQFAKAFLAKGGKIWNSSPYHTAYCRRRDGIHAFGYSGKEFFRAMGGRFLAFPYNRFDLVDGASFEISEAKGFAFPEYPEEGFQLRPVGT